MFAIKAVTAVAVAWQLVIDWPLPKKVRKYCDEFNQEESGELIAMSFPVVGLILGAALVFLAAVLRSMLGEVAGGVLFAILAILALELKDSGRSIRTVISGIGGGIEQKSITSGLSFINQDFNALSPIIASLVALIYLIIKLLGLGIISIYQPSWVIAVLVLGFTAQGFLATLPSALSDDAMLVVSEHSKHHLWLVAGFILLFFIATPVMPLLSFLVAIAGSYFFGNLCTKTGGLDPARVTMFGALIELSTIFIGAFAILTRFGS